MQTSVKKRAMSAEKRKTKIREYCFIASVVAWPLLLFFVFWVGGRILDVALAFERYDIESQSFKFVGWGNLFTNFRQFFGDFVSSVGMGSIVLRSLLYYAIGLVMLIPHILVSFCIYKKVALAGFFKIMLFLPSVISSVVWVLIFKNFVEFGLPFIVSKFGGSIKISLLKNPATAFNVLVFFSLWIGFSGGLVLYTGAMSRIPPDIVEAGKVDGMNVLQEFWYITLPLIFPTVSISLFTGVVGIFTGQPSTFTFYSGSAPGSTYTLGYYFFTLVFAERNTEPVSFPYATAATLVFSAIAIPLSFFIKHLCVKFGPEAEF